MKRLILGIMMLAMTALTMKAARALSEPFVAVQPDGSQLVVTLYGDEHASWLTTSDGVLLVEKDNAYYVATVSDRGVLTATKQLAHQLQLRGDQEHQLCQQQRRSLFFEQAERSVQKARRAQVTSPDFFPHKGSPKCLVILANFSDNQFSSDNPRAQFEQYFNGETQENLGHNEQNNLVSVREYFNQSSLGQYTPDFTVVGPVTLPETLDYYGKDEGSSKDVNFTQFCQDAVKAVDSQIDFKDFDNSGDGKVELVCIIYAGYGQSVSGNPANTIWPKCGYRGIETQDGVKVSYFNCSPELFRIRNGNDINGIGLFNHEFSHGLGLPDHYATVDAAKLDNQTPEFWDLMDYGEYASNGYAPVPYSAWEQIAMGWIEAEELTESKTIFPLTPTLKGGKAYKFGNGANLEECMLIEGEVLTDANNRKLGSYRGEGLLVWHIGYTSSTVSMGDYPNNTAGKPKVTVVPADGLIINGYRFVGKSSDGEYHPTEEKPWTQAQYIASLQGDPFPGTSGTTQLTAEQALPNYQFYSGDATPKQSLTNITETPDGLVSFDFNDGVTPLVHEVEGLTLDHDKLYAKEGQTKQLQAAILPVEAQDKRVYWTSTNESVATVDADGVITAIAEGTTLVIGRSLEHPALWQSCEIIVVKDEGPQDKEVITEDDQSLGENETLEVVTPFTTDKVEVEEGQIITIDAHEAEATARRHAFRALAADDIAIKYKPAAESDWTTAEVTTEVIETGYRFKLDNELATAINARGFAIEAKKPIVVTEIAVVAAEPEPEANYYIVGSMTDWQVVAEDTYKLTLNENAGEGVTEYMKTIDLEADAEFKVKSVQGETQTWYPDGIDNNYKIKKSSNYTVYFRPNGDGGADWHYGYIYAVDNNPSGIVNVKESTTNGGVLFDLQGRRFNGEPTQHGIYIVNGKKVAK